MIFTVPLYSGTLLANVAYRWMIDGDMGDELTDGVTKPSAVFPVFRIDADPPDEAEELIVYDVTDVTNWNVGQFLLSKLRIPPASQSVIVVPGVPADTSLCRVYGYLETLDNRAAANVTVTFQLISEPAKSERILVGPKLDIRTDSEGRISNAAGDPWVDLQRNDLLTPTTTRYRVTCLPAGMQNVSMTLAADLFDLSTLIT